MCSGCTVSISLGQKQVERRRTVIRDSSQTLQQWSRRGPVSGVSTLGTVTVISRNTPFPVFSLVYEKWSSPRVWDGSPSGVVETRTSLSNRDYYRCQKSRPSSKGRSELLSRHFRQSSIPDTRLPRKSYSSSPSSFDSY